MLSLLSIVATNIDDLIIAANANDKMQSVKHQLIVVTASSRWKMWVNFTTMCQVLWLNTIKEARRSRCTRNNNNIFRRCSKSTICMHMADAKVVASPGDPNINCWYCSMMATRPCRHISRSWSWRCFEVTSCPTEAHLTAVKRIFRYLKGSLNVTLKYLKSEDSQLLGYSCRCRLCRWLRWPSLNKWECFSHE